MSGEAGVHCPKVGDDLVKIAGAVPVGAPSSIASGVYKPLRLAE